MKEFYKRIVIPDYDIIVKEILNTIESENLSKNYTHSWIGSIWSLYKQCPTFRNFILPRLKQNIEQVKFYFTSPHSFLSAHIDGGDVIKIPFGLNLPLLNTKNTLQYWYNCPLENTIKRENIDKDLYTRNYLSDVHVPKDSSKMTVIEELELTTPTFTKTDIMHSVVNPTDNPRLVMVLRFGISKINYQAPEDVFRLEGLTY